MLAFPAGKHGIIQMNGNNLETTTDLTPDFV
jgi:hypothetical protein